MRKIAAAVAAASLAVALAAPPAAADPTEDVQKVSCGTIGPPLCEPLAEVLGLLAPLQPLLDLTNPALVEAGKVVGSLSELGLSGPGVPAAELEAAASSLADQLRAVPQPIAGILDATGQRQALLDALDQLLAALRALPAPVGDAAPGTTAGPSAEPQAEPAERPSRAPSGSVGSTSASQPSGFGASVSGGSAPTSRPTAARPASRGSVPGVPVGSTLDLSPLGLPTFSLDGASSLSSGAGSQAARDALRDVVLPAAQGAAAIDRLDGGDDEALAVMAALSALLVAAGLLVHQHRANRHVIPD